MSLAQWRQFNFFDKQQAIDPNDKGKTPAVFQKQDISVFATGRGHIVLAGNIYIVNRSFKTQKFIAYDGGRVTHLKLMKQKNILVSIGEEDTISGIPVVKFWDLDAVKHLEGDDDMIIPTLIRTIKIQHGGKAYPVSTLAMLENMAQLAIGLASGVVILIRGDLSKDKAIKQKVIYEGEEPITGLGFREQTKSTILFIVTTSSIMSYNTTAVKPAVTILDEQGCGLGCAVMNDQQEMVVGRDEAIYLYDPTGRGPCFAYDSPKLSLTWFKSNYLVIVSPPVITSSHLSSGARASLNFNSKRNSSATNELTKVAIFDTANKFVAYVGTFLGGIRGVFCEWNSIWIVGMDGKLYHLDEKDTPTKLEILFKLNLYVLAINLAHTQKYDDTSITEIFKKYGDHLYSRGDYDGSMEQYIRTIGHLEPSYVIRKFLDAQRIYNLTNYLQELHSKGLANTDHTTLLLNCYTKLKDVSRLDQFIKTDTDLNFDVETAITVCKQAGYYEHAVYLADKYQEHDMYLDIVIEDMNKYDTALSYIRKLGPYETDKNLQKYSKTLLSHLPEETTKLLIELCTGLLPLVTHNTTPSGMKSPTPSENTKALANLPFGGGADTGSIFSDQSAPTLTNGNNQSVTLSKLAQTKHASSRLAYTPPSPRKFMPSFVDRPDYLTTFLESVFEKLWGSGTPPTSGTSPQSDIVTLAPSVKGETTVTEKNWSLQEQEERKTIWNTLLELYLMDNVDFTREPVSARDRQRRKRESRQKALALLHDETVQYDTNQALVLCQLKEFDEGIVYLYERTKMYTDILRYWMDKGQTDRVIEGVRKYGPKDPSLYPMVLTYFSSTPEVMEKSTQELLSVMRHIDEKDLLPPIQVVQALSRSNIATIGLLKGYIGKKIQYERDELKQNEELIDSYREETEKRRKEIEELQTSARIFQVQKCSGCDGNLDLPAIHFLCRHSYHQRCLGDNERECPQCAIQHRMISEIRRTQEANADRHDLFFDQLDQEEDGFEIIADYFSKNTMAFAKLID